MSTHKVAITIEEKLLRRIDQLVSAHRFPNRSKAIQEAVAEKLERLDRTRLARECLRLDSTAEQQLADEGIGEDLGEWPAY
ncbi:MAG: ribbon-helix-helix domain-containing protein [Coprothermobacterota bacterium]|jgi:metal-responsive CopG/Arc/MetJ family transcriptional regulator|nr:ribbon-helix-helix domain-containing protein [Coprothermobacterota bacterium]